MIAATKLLRRMNIFVVIVVTSIDGLFSLGSYLLSLAGSYRFSYLLFQILQIFSLDMKFSYPLSRSSLSKKKVRVTRYALLGARASL